MNLWLYCAILNLLVSRHVQARQKRLKRAHADNFNVLLNIYKMNPLKKSNVYKMFSDQMLLPNRPDARSVVMNFDSNESRKERQANTDLHLKEIEKFIHVTNPKKKVMKQPDYDIENIDPEKFTVNMVMNDPSGVGGNERMKGENGFNSILGHLESSEIGDKLPVTKMVRVNHTIAYDNRLSSLETDFNEIGLNDNYTNVPISVTYETFADKKDKTTNSENSAKEHKEKQNFPGEGVVVLR